MKIEVLATGCAKGKTLCENIMKALEERSRVASLAGIIAMLPIIFMLMLTAAAHAGLPSATATNINQALTSGKPTLIDLGAGSCYSCRKMAPVLEGLSGEYQGKANVLFIDVHKDSAAAERYGIRMIPTQIFFDAKGKEVSRHIGFMDKAELLKGLKGAGLK